MIFRTGSVLIVGKCCESILNNIYMFVKNMLETEFREIHIPNVEDELHKKNTTKKQTRKKTIMINK